MKQIRLAWEVIKEWRKYNPETFSGYICFLLVVVAASVLALFSHNLFFTYLSGMALGITILEIQSSVKHYRKAVTQEDAIQEMKKEVLNFNFMADPKKSWFWWLYFGIGAVMIVVGILALILKYQYPEGSSWYYFFSVSVDTFLFAGFFITLICLLQRFSRRHK